MECSRVHRGRIAIVSKIFCEVEYRVAREAWHIAQALAASTEVIASSHMKFARLYGNYSGGLAKIHAAELS